MALVKQEIPISFIKGLDTKTDPNQMSLGKFQTLVNSVFDVTGRLTKRNGFPKVTTLPDNKQTTLTTLNDNLIATGSNLYAYSSDIDTWYNQGSIQPVRLDVQSLVRNSANQITVDMAVADTGLACIVYLTSGSPVYRIMDSVTGQQIVGETSLPATSMHIRTAILGRYFIITFLRTVSGATHLQYIAIPTVLPTSPSSATDIATNVLAINSGYDILSFNNNLFVAFENSTGGINVMRLTATLALATPKIIPGHTASRISLAADTANVRVWLSWYESGTQDGFTAQYDAVLAQTLAPVQVITNQDVAQLASASLDGVLTLLYEINNTYASPYPSAGVKTDFINKVTVTSTGTVSAPALVDRSIGLASKAFATEDNIYVLVAYGESNQPTYFLIDVAGNVYMRLAYQNGGGYITTQVLPHVNLLDTVYLVPYLIKDFLAPTNKGTNLPANTPVNSFYTQTGINLARLMLNNNTQQSSEIAGSLHLTGGQLWQYDSIKPVELGFHVWPENVQIATSTSGGSLLASTYYYQFCYEWTDNQGNLHRSAPSIPVHTTTTGSSSSNTLYVPTLRLTAKTGTNPVRIVGYRWSIGQQTYYQFTTILTPILNNSNIDFVAIVDVTPDAGILGQTLLYTTGGVLENIAPPASIDSALFKNRLFLIDAEDKNLLWYSKAVIENTPVEMSDLLTLFVAPTTGAQGSTGPMACISAMDDKFIIFKKNAIYYLTGLGPDNTGANNDFTDPIFITASVGCSNPNSIILTPHGLMFQSDKGIWMLGRDLSTQYIGAAVELYNSYTVLSAQVIPGTNQVRFTMNNNVTLMYDYFQNEWGAFTNLQAISSTLYQGLHTYLNEFGAIYQEKIGTYLDGSKPVCMSFTTSWLNFAGLQGYERFYYMHLLGTYYSPYALQMGIAYDYNISPSQVIMVTPDNYTPAWGGDANWGSNEAWGGLGNVFEARIFPEQQKCEAFQISMQEIYDPSFGVAAGQGLSLSGLNLTVGMKKGTRTSSSKRSFG